VVTLYQLVDLFGLLPPPYGEQERIQGNSKNLTGRTKAHIIGHGTEENGIRKLAGQDGTQIAKNLNDIIPQNAELTKVSLVSCNSATCAGNNTSLVQDVEKNLNNSVTEVKGYTDRIDANEQGKIISVTKGGLSGREGRDKENSQEGRQGFEIAQLNITGCHTGFAVSYNFCFAVAANIDCALVALNGNKSLNSGTKSSIE
jgi:hypothetical protein